jgi:hypothetical protein
MKQHRCQIRGKREKPAHREHYYLVLANGEIKDFPWNDTVFDYEVWDFGNCFRVRREAQQARDSIRQLLQQLFFDGSEHVATMDKEKLKEEIEMRLRYVFKYYVHEDRNDSFYLVRDEDLTRAADSIADLFDKTV